MVFLNIPYKVKIKSQRDSRDSGVKLLFVRLINGQNTHIHFLSLNILNIVCLCYI